MLQRHVPELPLAVSYWERVTRGWYYVYQHYYKATAGKYPLSQLPPIQISRWVHFVQSTASTEVIIVMWHPMYKNRAETVAWVKKLMIYGSLHRPGQMCKGGGSFYYWWILFITSTFSIFQHEARVLRMNPFCILDVTWPSYSKCCEQSAWFLGTFTSQNTIIYVLPHWVLSIEAFGKHRKKLSCVHVPARRARQRYLSLFKTDRKKKEGTKSISCPQP